MILLFLGFAACVPAAQAKDLFSPRADVLAASPPSANGASWAALLRTLLPDLAAAADGSLVAHEVADYRHIDGDDAYNDPPDDVRVTSLAIRVVREHGRPRLLVLVGVDPPEGALGMALLALIDPAPTPRLLDLVDVAGDRETYFDDSVRLDIGHGGDLIGILNAHLNAGEDAALVDLIYVRDDRFAKLAQIGRRSLTGCGFESLQTQSLALVPDPHAEFDSLAVTVVEAVRRTSGDCGAREAPRPGRRSWRTTFKWNPRQHRFDASSHDLEALQDHNAAP